MKMADMSQMQTRIRELEARRAKGESVPELDRLYEKMDSMQNKGYADAKRNLSGENLVKPVSREEQKKYSESLKRSREREMKQRGITGKQFADEANKDIRAGDIFEGYKKGGKIKKMASGGKVSSASKRADGCATKGKTKGKML
jgi:hypothetical protein